MPSFFQFEIEDQDKLRSRFLAIMGPRPSSECWVWPGYKNARGYGRFTFITQDGSRFSFATHRLSYELFVGPIEPGLFACHRCDNPPCCQPNDLFPGTPLDNVNDMLRKGRWPRLIIPSGDDVAELLSNGASNDRIVTPSEAARLLGCSLINVYKHVEQGNLTPVPRRDSRCRILFRASDIRGFVLRRLEIAACI